MNLRIVTIGSVLSLTLAVQPLVSTADQHGIATTPLRGSALENALDSEVRLYATPPEQAASPRSPPDIWRNPGSLRTAASLDRPNTHTPTNTEPMSANSAGHDPHPASVAQPSRTLIQRIRDRRLAQLQKQAERLRELSQRDGLHASEARPSRNLNGPENPDLQIDLGIPTEAASSTEDVLPLIGPSAASRVMQPGWTPNRPEQGNVPDLNSPASPPIEIQIDLPGDGEPQPPAQSRLRNWWGDPLR
jgi:hypothetical protein